MSFLLLFNREGNMPDFGRDTNIGMPRLEELSRIRRGIEILIDDEIPIPSDADGREAED